MFPPRRSLVAVCSLVAALACQPKGAAVQPGGDKPAGGGTTGGGNGDYAPLAPVKRAVELLPPSTLGFVEVAGATRIAEIVGRDALVAKFAAEYQKIAGDIASVLGHDILDPRQLGAIGVDAGGRMGAAMLGVEPFSFALWVTLSDAAKFRGMIIDRLGRDGAAVKTLPLGGAEVIVLREGREWVVLRAPFAVFVMREGGEAAGNEPALAIASADPNRALANDKEFRRATGGVAPADAMFYVDGAEVWRRVEEAIAVKEKRAEGESGDDTWRKREQAQRDTMKRMFTGVGTGVWTFNAKPNGIVGEGKIDLGAESLLLKLLRNQTSPAPLPKALDDRPLWTTTGAFEVGELVGFADLLLKTEGTSWAELGGEVKKEIGVDVDAELRPLVTGVGGFAVTYDGAPKGDADPSTSIGVSAHLELTDGAKAQVVLDKLGNAAVADMKKRKASGRSEDVAVKREGKGWVVDVTKWRKLHVSIAGKHLVVSTDPSLAKRIAAGGSGKGSKQVPSAALAAAGWENAAYGSILDLELSSLAFAGRMTSSFGSSMVESPDDAKVPRSKAYKAKQKQIAAVDAKLQKAENRRAAQMLEQMRNATTPWGAMAGSLREDGNAFVFTGGLFVRAKNGVAGALLESLTAVKAMSNAEVRDDEIGKLFEQRAKLDNELSTIREADLVKARGKGSAAVPAVPIEAPPPG